ncbi:MAG: aminotransferase class I/II-fold pyridoxal phosphate-dependent enzyme [Candidatus Aminicenantes bacterium]|nr:aminotransferase class I/II-fold pyridoxal phosphate-dependent enzyme [Candidatus Aminicenantes bacterium]
MKIEPFQMERMQSTWENRVEFNLSESGVHPLSLHELLDGDADRILQDVPLGYIQSNGTAELRQKICGLYPGSTINNILVTTGSAEANFLLAWSFIEPGDRIVYMLPNYMQTWGLYRAFGAEMHPFYLKEEHGWNPDPEELKRLISKKTKIILVTNPNNPTGAVLSKDIMDLIVKLAGSTGAWIFSDEVYQGAEKDGKTTPSFWGRYDKVIVSNGLSKAYGLPGLRTGWIAAPSDIIDRTWSYHDYTTISLSTVSDRLARIALTPDKRNKILARTRAIINQNLPVLTSWLDKRKTIFKYIPPQAGAILYTRYNLEIPSIKFVERLRQDKSVLLVPGDHFEMGKFLRIGFGEKPGTLQAALDRVENFLATIAE